MKRSGLFVGFLAVLVFVLSNSTADEKKDVKKDETKKDEKKDPEKKVEPKKEKLVYGVKFQAKILSFKAESARDLTVETQERDPKKMQEVQNWAGTRQQQLMQQYSQALSQKDFKARMSAVANWQKDSAAYQQDLAKRSANVFSPKANDIRAHETAKVRAMTPPVEFDDNTGKMKVWTKKELEAMKDKTGLPGYPVDFDALKPGQYVEIYTAKAAPKKKKGPDDDDPPPMKTEFVLIVILQEAK